MTAKRLPLHAVCPYFAMFPERFAREHIEAYSRPGDVVFDPFSGRGTTVLEALLLGREAAASDINPVALCVSGAKARRPRLPEASTRIEGLAADYLQADIDHLAGEVSSLPPFFRRAFHWGTLRELLFLRSRLDWRESKTDGFIAALTIGSLHGEMDRSSAYFSNQMPRTICLKPDYSLRYWREKGLYPKRRRVFDMLRQKAELRLSGLPKCGSGTVKMSDARRAGSAFRSLRGRVSLVVTSPPYFGVTRYEEDQWLRLWFLGGAPHPTYGKISRDDRHEGKSGYWRFLEESWRGIAPLLKERAVLVIRLGSIGMDEDEMTEGLLSTVTSALPGARLMERPARSEIVRRQSQNFAPKSRGCRYELDFTLQV